MSRLVGIFTLLLTVSAGYFVWAEQVLHKRQPQVYVPPKMSDLAPGDTRAVESRVEQHRRAPASARVIDPDSGAKVYLYGACRAPDGMIFYPNQKDDYESCMNSEAPYNGKGLFHSKGLGVGIVID